MLHALWVFCGSQAETGANCLMCKVKPAHVVQCCRYANWDNIACILCSALLVQLQRLACHLEQMPNHQCEFYPDADCGYAPSSMYQTTLMLNLPPLSSFLASFAAFCQTAADCLLAWQILCPWVTPKDRACPQYPLDYAVALCSSSAESHSRTLHTVHCHSEMESLAVQLPMMPQYTNPKKHTLACKVGVFTPRPSILHNNSKNAALERSRP